MPSQPPCHTNAMHSLRRRKILKWRSMWNRQSEHHHQRLLFEMRNWNVICFLYHFYFGVFGLFALRLRAIRNFGCARSSCWRGGQKTNTKRKSLHLSEATKTNQKWMCPNVIILSSSFDPPPPTSCPPLPKSSIRVPPESPLEPPRRETANGYFK